MLITEVSDDTVVIPPRKSSKSYTICLNMIVKNESHIIVQTLTNLCSYVDFDAYFISDTGSTDNTMELIRAFFKERGIPGHIEQVEWRDFGFNRTLALQMAFNKTDYLFIFDADDSIHGDFRLPRDLTHDAYQLKLGQSFVYLRTLIVNNRKRWRFVGVLHEYITCIDKEESCVSVQGDYYVESGRSGSRSKDPNKYINDAAVLERGYNDECGGGGGNGSGGGDRGLAERYSFYCAQSWMDAGVAYIDKAILWYLRVLTQNNWSQEKYYSALCLGDLYNKKGDKYNSLKYYSKTMEYDEERIEGVASAMEILRSDGNHILVNALYHKYKGYNKFPQNKLFLATDKYHDVIEYNNSISAFYISDRRSGYECCKTILRHNIVAFHLLKSTYSNLVFYRNFFEEDTFPEILRLFYVVDHYLAIVASNNDTYSDDDIETWNCLFAKVRDSLVAPCELLKIAGGAGDGDDKTCEFHLSRPIERLPYLDKNMPAQNPSVVIVNRKRATTPRVIITFTTCKRLDLFQQTVNSILNMWTDINMIDYWYCVDDNSSEEDRAKMRHAYPWIDFYMKSLEEKGHRASMKNIWDKLNELRPEYWIHMEDDFLFHSPGSYVGKAIQMMTDTRNSGYNVRQILYNRNYGETVRDYKIQGHKLLRRMTHEVALHRHKVGEEFGYGNCHYWPHYSFRPSLIDVAAILTVGNYDTPNQFFEMDYANQWMKLGFLSGFYNQITNRHIGRLTSERNDQTQPNAYELNNESQFVATTTTTTTDAATTDTATTTVDTTKKQYYYSTIPFDDGFGAQFQRFIWTCIYAEECEDATFIYRTPTKIAHNYNDDPQFISKLETLMNMKPYYTNYADVTAENAKLIEAGRNEQVIEILTPHFYDIFNYIEKNIDACMKSKSMARIKEHYWRNKDRPNERARIYRTDGSGGYTHHLAAHIRRPNCDDTRPNGGEEYTNAYYIRSFLTIREKYPNKRIQFHVYSQGTDDKFADLLAHDIIGRDIILHLNESNEDTYLGMTLADILVTSASSYSYSAAFFCDGDIYYTKFWHTPCSWWNKLEKLE
jgi:tetratricopeptide (TPR) repeat protein